MFPQTQQVPRILCRVVQHVGGERTHTPVGALMLLIQLEAEVFLQERRESEGKNVIMAAFGAHFDLKQVIVVDDDVDVHNPTEVEWAVATRFQADRDLVVVSGAQGSPLDPSTTLTGRVDGMSAKMGLDATRPLKYEGHTFTRVRVPGEEKVDLDKVIDPNPQSVLDSLLKG